MIKTSLFKIHKIPSFCDFWLFKSPSKHILNTSFQKKSFYKITFNLKKNPKHTLRIISLIHYHLYSFASVNFTKFQYLTLFRIKKTNQNHFFPYPPLRIQSLRNKKDQNHVLNQFVRSQQRMDCSLEQPMEIARRLTSLQRSFPLCLYITNHRVLFSISHILDLTLHLYLSIGSRFTPSLEQQNKGEKRKDN